MSDKPVLQHSDVKSWSSTQNVWKVKCSDLQQISVTWTEDFQILYAFALNVFFFLFFLRKKNSLIWILRVYISNVKKSTDFKRKQIVQCPKIGTSESKIRSEDNIFRKYKERTYKTHTVRDCCVTQWRKKKTNKPKSSSRHGFKTNRLVFISLRCSVGSGTNNCTGVLKSYLFI